MQNFLNKIYLVAKLEEDDSSNKGGEVFNIDNESKSKIYYNGYWSASHNIAHDIKELIDNSDIDLLDKQTCINFAQSLLKDYSTQEVTLEDLNKFLEK